MMTLQEYLRISGTRQADFGRSIDVTQGTVSRLCTGRMLPDLVMAAKIERQTNGAVPLGVWVKIEEHIQPSDADKRSGAAA